MFNFVEKNNILTYNLVRGEFMAIYWFIAFVILLVIEIATINLVSIWFAIGAIAAMFTAFFTKSIFIQMIIFIIVSLISLVITKPLIKKVKNKEVVPTNSDRIIGKRATVIKTIDKDEYGEVKVYGNVWTACSDSRIEIGTKVKVLSIDGVKLIVKKEEE